MTPDELASEIKELRLVQAADRDTIDTLQDSLNIARMEAQRALLDLSDARVTARGAETTIKNLRAEVASLRTQLAAALIGGESEDAKTAIEYANLVIDKARAEVIEAHRNIDELRDRQFRAWHTIDWLRARHAGCKVDD